MRFLLSSYRPRPCLADALRCLETSDGLMPKILGELSRGTGFFPQKRHHPAYFQFIRDQVLEKPIERIPVEKFVNRLDRFNRYSQSFPLHQFNVGNEILNRFKFLLQRIRINPLAFAKRPNSLTFFEKSFMISAKRLPSEADTHSSLTLSGLTPMSSSNFLQRCIVLNAR